MNTSYYLATLHTKVKNHLKSAQDYFDGEFCTLVKVLRGRAGEPTFSDADAFRDSLRAFCKSHSEKTRRINDEIEHIKSQMTKYTAMIDDSRDICDVTLQEAYFGRDVARKGILAMRRDLLEIERLQSDFKAALQRIFYLAIISADNTVEKNTGAADADLETRVANANETMIRKIWQNLILICINTSTKFCD